MLDALRKIWVKHLTKFIVFLTVIFLLIGLANFYFVFVVTAQSNDECLWTMKKASKDSVVILFDQVKEDGVTWEAGIRNGDQLISIDGIKTPNTTIASRILDRVSKGDYATYVVKRGDKEFETHVLVKKLINFSGLGIALLSFLWLLVSFIVIISKPQGKLQMLFFRVSLYSVMFAVSNWLYRGSMVENPIFINVYVLLIVDTFFTFGGIFFPFALVHFFSVFPKELAFTFKKWFKWVVYVMPAFFFVIATILKLFFVFFGRTPIVYNVILQFINMLVLLGFIVGLVLLFINYMKMQTKRERNSVFVILVAYLVGVLAIIYTSFLAPSIAGIIFNNPAYFTPIILVALIPLAFGYSIFRYSLMDLSDFVRNAVVYGVATVALGSVYFLVIYILGQSISSAIGTEYQGVIAGVVFVAFAFIFQSTKDRFQNLLTEKFYPEQYTFQKNLLKFSNDIAAVVGYENILDSTKDLFVQSLKLNHFGLMIKDENQNEYKLVKHQGIKNRSIIIKDDLNLVEKHFLDLSVYSKKTFIDRQDFKTSVYGIFAQLINEEIYTVIPLVIKSKVIGLLLFGIKYSGSQFTDKDVELLVFAASQTAVSIENARLYESELEKQKMERDLENARKIQESLLPKKYPEIQGVEIYGDMIPAMQIGGDYYDFIEAGENKFFVVIGDVSGKGLSASFYMSKLQTMIRLHCQAEKSPKEILTEINKRIYLDIEKNWFITVSLALFDFSKQTIKYCRAGHTPLLKVNAGMEEILQPMGVGIGLDRGSVFENSLEEIEIEISNGDLFFFFSDGVTEIMNKDDEMYGLERTTKFIKDISKKPCNEISTALLLELDEFRGKVHQYDDVTFVIIKKN